MIEESLGIARSMGDEWLLGYALFSIGEIARAEGKYDWAKQAYLDVLETSQELRYKLAIAVAFLNLGFVAIHDGELNSAQSYLAKCLSLEQELNANLAWPLIGFAGLATVEKKPQQAIRLLSCADTQLSADDKRLMTLADKAEHERYLAAAREQLDEATFNVAWAEGQKMTLEQAVEYALAMGG